MLKTKLFTAIAVVAALLLLAPAAYAADEKTTTGSFTAGGADPTVDAIDIYDTEACDGTPVTSMTPQVEYWAKVTVTANNKLKQLESVQVTIFYDSAGLDPVAPTDPNTHSCAILTWTASPESWTIAARDPGTQPTTTWSNDPLKSHRPANLNATTGDWRFHFVPGQVAAENAVGDWDAQGLAKRTPTSTGELYVRDKDMEWFGQVTVSGTVDWGEVELGLAYGDSPPNPQVVTNVNYIANGGYSENIKSTDWTGDVTGDTVVLNESGTPGAEGELALKADDTDVLGSAVVVNKTTYTPMDDTGTMTEEAGDDIITNNLWLSLSAAGIAADDYEGTIYYQVDVD